MNKIGVLLLLLLVPAVHAANMGNAAEDQTVIRNMYRIATEGLRVTIDTTTVAGTITLLVGTHTAQNFVVASGVNYTTGPATAAGFATSTTTTYGGRAYAAFQVITATEVVRVDIGTMSVTGSPYYDQKDWIILDDPLAVQEPIYVYSAGTARLRGWYWTEKRR